MPRRFGVRVSFGRANQKPISSKGYCGSRGRAPGELIFLIYRTRLSFRAFAMPRPCYSYGDEGRRGEGLGRTKERWGTLVPWTGSPGQGVRLIPSALRSIDRPLRRSAHPRPSVHDRSPGSALSARPTPHSIAAIDRSAGPREPRSISAIDRIGSDRPVRSIGRSARSARPTLDLRDRSAGPRDPGSAVDD